MTTEYSVRLKVTTEYSLARVRAIKKSPSKAIWKLEVSDRKGNRDQGRLAPVTLLLTVILVVTIASVSK